MQRAASRAAGRTLFSDGSSGDEYDSDFDNLEKPWLSAKPRLSASPVMSNHTPGPSPAAKYDGSSDEEPHQDARSYTDIRERRGDRVPSTPRDSSSDLHRGPVSTPPRHSSYDAAGSRRRFGTRSGYTERAGSPQRRVGGRPPRAETMVDPRASAVFLRWKREVWTSRVLRHQAERAFENLRRRDRAYYALRDWRAAAAAAGRRRWLLQRVVHRLWRRAATHCFARWKEVARDGRRRAAVLQRVVWRLRSQQARAAFGSWADQHRYRKRAVRVMLRRLQAQALHALNSWRGFVALRRRHKAVLRRTLGHLQNQAVASAFERWGELPKAKRRAVRVLLRMVQSRTWSAFHSWTTWAVQQHRDAAVMLRAVRKIQHRFAAGAFERWVELLRICRRVARVLQRMVMLVAGKAFRSWAAALARARRQQAVLERAICRMLRGHLASALAGWRGAAEGRRRYRAVGRRLMHFGLAKALEAWKAQAATLRAAKGTLARLLNRQAAAAFDTLLAIPNPQELFLGPKKCY
jgi:hypothetical protein